MMLRIFIVFLICSNVFAAESRSLRRTPTEKMQAVLDEANLKKAIDLAVKTSIGQGLKTYIDELMADGKIYMLLLEDGHYGESGEGCVVKNQQYIYEGLFIHLNRKLSIVELSSALIHEASHYKLIKFANDDKLTLPISVGELEIFAFATQYEYIKQLENMQLAYADDMFGNDATTIIEVMQSAQLVTNNWTEPVYDIARTKLIDFGYPAPELDRHLVIRNEDECKGKL